MEIVTGHRGTPHVTPYKVRDFNIGIVGAEDYVMNGGSELEAQLVSNNRIDIKDGSICMQGTHAVIPKNINDELTIENGMQGEKRIDLIVARYEKVADSGVESVNTVVLQGTPSKESPIVPGHVVGDIRNGDLKHEMPLYEVELDGINVIEVRPVFKKIVSAAEQQKMIELLNGNYNLITEHGMVDLTTNLGSKADILASALEATHFLSVISTGGSSTNVPSDEFRYSAGLVLRRTSEQVSIILFGRNNMIATNFWNGSRWTGWKTR